MSGQCCKAAASSRRLPDAGRPGFHIQGGLRNHRKGGRHTMSVTPIRQRFLERYVSKPVVELDIITTLNDNPAKIGPYLLEDLIRIHNGWQFGEFGAYTEYAAYAIHAQRLHKQYPDDEWHTYVVMIDPGHDRIVKSVGVFLYWQDQDNV